MMPFLSLDLSILQQSDCCIDRGLVRICGFDDVIDGRGYITEGGELTFKLKTTFDAFYTCFQNYEPMCNVFDVDDNCQINLRDFQWVQNSQNYLRESDWTISK